MTAFLVLNAATLTISFWYLKKCGDCKLIENIVILEIASIIFNLLFGLFLLFDFMEANHGDLINNLLRDGESLSWFITCFTLSIFHVILSIFVFLIVFKRNGLK